MHDDYHMYSQLLAKICLVNTNVYMLSCADDDEEYEDNNRGFNLGFIFGNVDNSGDLDADYLDEVICFTLSVWWPC